jgi:hypothetical protein
MNINTEQYQQLLQWFDSESGVPYLQEERCLYEKHLTGLRGNHVLLPKETPFQALSGLGHFKNTHPFDLIDFSKKLICPDAAFDCIILPHILEFCSEPKLILLEMQRLLNPEGTLLISGFCFQWLRRLISLLGSELDRKIANIKPLSGSYLRALAHLIGLDRCVISHFDNPQFPLVHGGYLLALRSSEYGVQPLTIQTLRKPLDLLATPSMANLSNNRSLIDEKS